MQQTSGTRRWGIVIVLAITLSCGDQTEPPVPSRLEFVTQPTDAVAGAVIGPRVRVRVLDESGNMFTGPMTVTLALTGPTDATLLGTTSVAASDGVATFSDLRIEKSGTGYVLNASAPALAGAASSPFDVGHAAAARLRFAQQPAQTTAGQPISPAITVEIQDHYGNRATNATHAITVAVVDATAGGQLTGTKTADAVAGLATFDRITVNVPGTYTVGASAAGLLDVRSTPFVVQRTTLARFCPADVMAGASFDNIHAAITSTEPGGTIAFCDGTHQMPNVWVSRPLTITAEHAHKATLSGSGGGIFTMWGAEGDYVIRDLNLVVDEGAAVGFGRNIADPAMRGYAQALVENNRFTITSARGEGVVIAASDVPGAKAIVRGNVFTGGVHGVRTYWAGAVEIVDNTFNDQVAPNQFRTSSTIELQNGGPHVVRNNSINNCPEYCIQVHTATASILENRMQTAASRATLVGINVIRSTATVARNVIGGESAVANRQDPTSYSYRWGGILVQHEGVVTLDGNSISNAWIGIWSNESPATGQDNTVRLVRMGIQASSLGPALHRSDVLDYVDALVVNGTPPPGLLSCNYWDSPSGPKSSFGPSPSSYTPFSPVPIANRPEVVCP